MKLNQKHYLDLRPFPDFKWRYITVEDVNIGVSDIDHIYTETNNVCGVDIAHGGSGNPSPWTALGVFGNASICTKSIWR